MAAQNIIIVAGNTTVTKNVTVNEILQCRCRGKIQFAIKEPLGASLPKVRYCTGAYDERYDPVYRYLSRQLANNETLDEVFLKDLKLKESVTEFCIMKGEELNTRKAAGEVLGEVFECVSLNKTLHKDEIQDDFIFE